MKTCNSCKHWIEPRYIEPPVAKPPMAMVASMDMVGRSFMVYDRSRYEYQQELKEWEENESIRMEGFGDCSKIPIIMPRDYDSEGLAQVRPDACEYDELTAYFETKATFGCVMWEAKEQVPT